jgi:hypothetical protein
MSKIPGTRLGKGLGQLTEIAVPAITASLPTDIPHRAFRTGSGCHIMVGHELTPRPLWHLSISHPHRYPTWDEISEARYLLTPDGVTMAMLLPPRSEYVNVHDTVFHLWQVDDPRVGIEFL